MGKSIYRHDRNDEQHKDYDGYESTDDFVNAGGRVKINEIAFCETAQCWRTQQSLFFVSPLH